MGVQNINFFEQHVEKIVLGVAAAGAVFMGYLALQPISYIPAEGGEPVTASNVETQISKELEHVAAIQKNLEPNPNPTVPNYVKGYQDLAQGQPLDAAILVAGNASFGPRNVAPGQSIISPTDDWKIVTPAPVGPETDDPATVDKKPVEERLLRAQALQVQVNTDAPQVDNNGAPVALPAGVVLRTHSVNVVVIDGYVPLGKMIKDMLTPTDPKSRVLPDLQKAEIYRIEVTRKEQSAGGGWSDWKVVPVTKGSAAPIEISWNADTDLVGRLADVDLSFKQIMLPDFYRKEDGTPLTPPIITRPLPPNIDSENQTLARDIDAAKVGAVTGGVRPGMTPGGVMPGTPAAAAMLPTAAEQIKVLPVVPFTFWDETVQPDHKYQYRVEVKIVNPTYGSKLGLANPKMKDQPLISTGPGVVPGMVVVHSDMAFFLNGFGGIGGGTKLSGNIYKQDNGQWFKRDFTVDIGGTIGVSMKLSSGQVNVDTKFTVVDCQNQTHVILRDPAGNLVTRDLPDDWKKTERQELDDKVKAGAAAAAATAPGELTPTLTTTTPPTTPTPSRSTATPPAPTPPTPARGPATRGAPVLVNPPRGTTQPG